MTAPLPLVVKRLYGTNKLLGLMLFGITFFAQQGRSATLFTEVTDFGNGTATATDLSAEFVNFALVGKVVGQITLSNMSTDFADYFIVNASPSSAVNIPFTCVGSADGGYFGFSASTTDGTYLAGSGGTLGNAGVVLNGVLSFTVPASGKVMIGTNQDAGDTTFRYTLGMVPEPSTGLMGSIVIAAATLRRRRKVV